MKTRILVLLFLSCIKVSKAGDIYLIKYSFYKNLKGNNERGGEGYYDAELFIGKEYLYRYFIKEKTNVLGKAKLHGFFSLFTDSVVLTVSSKDFSPPFEETVFHKNNSFYEHLLGVKGRYNYVVLSKYGNPVYKDMNKDTTIRGKNCRKYSTTYYGRDYILCCSKDIKHSIGPWKFINLPGALILGYSTDENLIWEFKSIKKVEEMPKIKFNLDSTITYNEFLEKERIYSKKIIKFENKRYKLVNDSNVKAKTFVGTGRVKFEIGDGIPLNAVIDEKIEKTLNP